MAKKRRLGRGLEALLGPQPGAAQEEDVVSHATASNAGAKASQAKTATVAADGQPGDISDMVRLSVAEIQDNPFQPRREFDEKEIAALAESLADHDMLQPVLVRQIESGYQLISGERRLRAAIQAGWTEVPARIREADDRLVAELAIVENLQRKDLNPLEKALSFRNYIDQHDCAQDDLAKRLKIDRSTIANLMRLLELPAPVQHALRNGDLTAGHARALLPLGDEDMQIAFAQRIKGEGWSVRETERQVAQRIDTEDGIGPKLNKKSARTISPQVESLQQQLRVALGSKVEIKQSAKGRGRIVVHFTSHEEFDRLRELLTEDASFQRAG